MFSQRSILSATVPSKKRRLYYTAVSQTA